MYRLSKLVTYSIKAVEKVLSRLGASYEIVVVDDGSPDDTYQWALRASKSPCVKVYRLPRNMGKGFALIYGYRRSRGRIIVFLDGDLDIDPRQVWLLLAALAKHRADIAITSKWHPQSKTIATPIRKLLSKSFIALERLVLGIRLSDTQTGAKAFRRRVLDAVAPRLRIKRYAFDAELLYIAMKMGFRIVEVPALWRVRLASRFSPREILRMLLDLLAIAYRNRFAFGGSRG